MINKYLLTLLVVLIMPGCSVYHVDSEDLTTDYFPSKSTAGEVVYIESVDQPHEIIAQVTVNAERRQRISEVLTKMKREAAILGADAITNIKTDATGEWKELPVQKLLGNAYVRANFMVSAVAFK